MKPIERINSMKYINEFSVSMDGLRTHLDMMECYIDSAGTLHGVAIDGLIKNKSGAIGFSTNDVYHQKIIIAFFLLRHALELGIKALIHEQENFDHDIPKKPQRNGFVQFYYNFLRKFGLIKDTKGINQKLYGHNLKKLWSQVNCSYINDRFSKEIQKGFSVLSKYKLLKDAQLIRYHVDNNGKRVKDLPSIETKDFKDLFEIVSTVRYAVLEVLEAIYQRQIACSEGAEKTGTKTAPSTDNFRL